MSWMLDSNAWIHCFKTPVNRVRENLRDHPATEILTCSIIKAELLLGALKYGVPERRLVLIRNVLGVYSSLPFDDAAAEIYKDIRHALELQGQMIGALDLQIASICVLHKCTLVTHNTREFSRVPGLALEDWSN